MKKLRDQEGYIPLNEHTDRQAWALGYLCESFYKAGNLFEQSEERDIEIKSKLSEQGYEESEISPIIAHFNVCVAHLNKEGEQAKQRTINDIKDVMKTNRNKPPAPAPKPKKK